MSITNGRVLVCVTGQKTCERLILQGSAMAKSSGAEMTVLHVAKKGFHFLGNPHEGEALEYLFEQARKANAEMLVLRNDDFVKCITQYAKKHGVTHMVIGSPETPSGKNLLQRLDKELPDVCIAVSAPLKEET